MDLSDELKIEEGAPDKSFRPSSPFQMMFESMTKDMNFVGTFVLIYGVLNCLSIIGMIIGIPLIFAGLHLRGAGEHFSLFKTTNNSASMRTGFELQGKFYRIIKIIIIVSLVLTALSIIFFIFFFTFFMAKLMTTPY